MSFRSLEVGTEIGMSSRNGSRESGLTAPDGLNEQPVADTASVTAPRAARARRTKRGRTTGCRMILPPLLREEAEKRFFRGHGQTRRPSGRLSDTMSSGGSDLDITGLLVAWERGDDEALRRVAPLVYDDLRAIAAAQLRGERQEHTLQPTALVHEAYLRLSEQRRRQWKERRQFFAVASRLIRQVLVDHARARQAAKRGGEATRIEVTALGEIPAPPEVFDVLPLDEALTRLAMLQPRLAKVVELRFFGGLEVEETAALLDCSPRTVKRDWALARAWLVRELSP